MYNNTLKIAILTLSVGEEYTDSVYYGLKSKEEYCKKYSNCTFILKKEKHPDLINTGISWSKLAYVRDILINADYDYVFMSDADVIFMNDNFDIIEMIQNRFSPSKKIYISSETAFVHAFESDSDAVKNRIKAPSGGDLHEHIFQNKCLCAGNMFFKKNDWTINFINRWLSVDHSKYAPDCEQTPFNEIYYSDETVQNNVQVIHNQHLFNSFVTYCYRTWTGGDFLCHAAMWDKEYLKPLFFLFNRIKKNPSFENKYCEKILFRNNNLIIYLEKYLTYKIFKFDIETMINIKNIDKHQLINNYYNNIIETGEWFHYDENILFVLPNNVNKWILFNI